MLQKYKTLMNKLMQYGADAPDWEFFDKAIMTDKSRDELRQLVMSVCGPYSIPEYAVLDPDTIPVIMYSDEQKGFMIQFETSSAPVFMYELEIWYESIIVSWEDVKDGTDEQLERIAKELVCHAVNSYFTGMAYERRASLSD